MQPITSKQLKQLKRYSNAKSVLEFIKSAYERALQSAELGAGYIKIRVPVEYEPHATDIIKNLKLLFPDSFIGSYDSYDIPSSYRYIIINWS